jgi:hypothetical protein
MKAQNSLCFIIPFFAKPKLFQNNSRFPRYFDYFIETFARNTTIDLQVLTNLPFAQYKKYNNIVFHELSFLHLTQSLSKAANATLNPLRFYPAKICDFKPAFGSIFADYLQGYEFWGYCDVDMVIGNLSQFFTEENMQEYDLVTASKGNPGYMTVYRNCEKMNTLFRSSPDYQRVFKSYKNYRFDEKGVEGIRALTQIVQQQNIKVNNLPGLVHNDCGSMNQQRNWQYRWETGELVDCLTGASIGALHLVKSKRQKGFVIGPLQQNQGFEITRQGIKWLAT